MVKNNSVTVKTLLYFFKDVKNITIFRSEACIEQCSGENKKNLERNLLPPKRFPSGEQRRSRTLFHLIYRDLFVQPFSVNCGFSGSPMNIPGIKNS